jgi:hypothetical protein
MLRLIFVAATLFIISSGCADSSVPAGRILVRNTSEDKTFNVVEVSAGNKNFSLKPGDEALLPKGVSKIYFSREYSDHTKRYVVECPANPPKGIAMKLLDVHLNRIAGGCKTIKYSK